MCALFLRRWVNLAGAVVVLLSPVWSGAVVRGQEKPPDLGEHQAAFAEQAEGEDYEAAEREILRKLQQAASLAFTNEPLAAVIAKLGEKYELRIFLDRRALADAAIDTNTPITCSVAKVSLRSALRLLLNELDLTFVIDNRSVVITTKEVANTWIVTRVYDVASVIEKDNDESLVEVITRIVSPSFWENAGGPGSTSMLRNRLSVTSTQDIHDQVVLLVGALSQARQQQENAKGEARFAVLIPDAITAQNTILNKVTKQLDVEFKDQPLADVAMYFQKALEVPVQIDGKALADAAIVKRTPITFSAKAIAARDAMRFLLKELDLTWIIENDSLIFTTTELARTKICIRVYPVADLAADGAYKRVIETITSAVEPSSWDHAGGPGSIAACERCRSLVIANTAPVHERVEDRLKSMR